MSERPVKPIPVAGSWIQNVNERAILYVSEVDPVKERIQIKRFARYGAEGMEFAGRTTWLSYETYRKGSRYMPREAPVNPDCLPEKITQEQAQEALELEGWSTGAASEELSDASVRLDYSMHTDRERAILRAYLGKPTHAVTPPDGMPVTIAETLTDEEAIVRLITCGSAADRDVAKDRLLRAQELLAAYEQIENPTHFATSEAAILCAYVRGLDAKIVNLFDGPEHNNVPATQPTIVDVLAAIEALRAEVRADRKPLLDAVDRVLAADSTWVDTTYPGMSKVLDDLRATRAKV